MRPLQALTIALVAGSVLSFAIAACGSDDSSPQDASTMDAAPDGSTDAASDASPGDASDASNMTVEELCTSTGGSLDTNVLCCEMTPNFVDMCGVGPCGCAPQYSHATTQCRCVFPKCFSLTQGCIDGPAL